MAASLFRLGWPVATPGALALLVAACENPDALLERHQRGGGADSVSEPLASQEVYRALQRRARDEGRGIRELFEFYLLERFLYRLSVSLYRGRFVLKGGLLLMVLGVRRPTRDADVLARGVAGDEQSLLAVVKEVVSISVEDGMTFDASQARAMTIREHAAYPGYRPAAATPGRQL